MSRGKKVGAAVVLAIAFATLLIVSEVVCLSAWVRYGMTVAECPSGTVVQGVAVHAYGLRRGTEGTVEVTAVGNYTTGASHLARSTSVGRVDASLELLVGDTAQPLVPKAGWEDTNSGVSARVKLPRDLPDGTHRLRATIDTPLGKNTHEVPLPVYAPAKVHVITDRPLYEPGHTIQFRATVLRARDLVPLEGRPGRFIVVDPNGTTVLDESAPAGAYGVASGDFPVDVGAPVGDYQIRWSSGGTVGERSVRVGPFELPRFSIEANPGRPFYRPRQEPSLRGNVRYSSGAPVGGARIAITWQTTGEWPPPPKFVTALPAAAFTDESGRFELKIPAVPGDLRGRVWLIGTLRATDPSGDVVAGSASLLFSEDAIMVDVVTELDGRLVDGFNNRLYLRATTPTAVPLANAKIVVKRAWDETDDGVEAIADEDGVASFQLDPGPPVNVVVPPMPVRPPPRPPAVKVTNIRERVADRYDMADRRTISLAEGAMGRCVHLVDAASETVSATMIVRPDGRVVAVTTEPSLAARCVAGVLRSLSLRGKFDRVYEVTVELSPDLPGLSLVWDGVPVTPEEVAVAIQAASRRARACVATYSRDSSLSRMLIWRLDGDSKLALRFGADPAQSGVKTSGAVASCIQREMLRAAAAMPPLGASQRRRYREQPHFGFVRISTTKKRSESIARPHATTFLGYELKVIAAGKDGEAIGDTKATVRPGTIPAFRIRATPTIASAGERVELAFLRGPGFTGELPKKIWVRSHEHNIEVEIDSEKKRANFTIPNGADGWFETSWGGARALVFVRSAVELSVDVTPDHETYRPGEKATLSIVTKAGGKPTAAGVGLFGVDNSLGQLVPLPGPTDMSDLRGLATMSAPAFGVLDAKALAMGRIRGANAIAATVLRVTQVPAAADIDAYTSADGRTPFDPIGPLTDHFYEILAELHEKTRAWETSAPKGEVMKVEKMAALFDDAIGAVEARGQPVDDAYGRRLRLHRLPGDLLALTDPRAVVIEGTRLPEDVENWTAWVGRNRP